MERAVLVRALAEVLVAPVVPERRLALAHALVHLAEEGLVLGHAALALVHEASRLPTRGAQRERGRLLSPQRRGLPRPAVDLVTPDDVAASLREATLRPG